MVTGLPTLQGSIFSRHASNVSDHDPPRLNFQHLKLLNLTLMRILHQLFTLMRIWIQLPKIIQIRIPIRNPAIYIYLLTEGKGEDSGIFLPGEAHGLGGR